MRIIHRRDAFQDYFGKKLIYRGIFELLNRLHFSYLYMLSLFSNIFFRLFFTLLSPGPDRQSTRRASRGAKTMTTYGEPRGSPQRPYDTFSSRSSRSLDLSILIYYLIIDLLRWLWHLRLRVNLSHWSNHGLGDVGKKSWIFLFHANVRMSKVHAVISREIRARVFRSKRAKVGNCCLTAAPTTPCSKWPVGGMRGGKRFPFSLPMCSIRGSWLVAINQPKFSWGNNRFRVIPRFNFNSG